MIANKTALTHSPHIVKGATLAIVAFFFMAVFGVLTKVACSTGDFIWVSFLTYTTAALGTGICIFPQGLAGLKSQHYGYLIARATIGTLASFLYMVSMHYIAIVNATLLFNTAPIFIPIITAFVLKIHVQKVIWYAVLLGFVGILIIIKPGESLFTDPGNLIALVSGIALAIAYLCMKYLTATDTGLRIIFYYFFIGVLMQIPLLWFTEGTPALDTILYSCLCGISLMSAQLGLVKAYTYATASEVGVYQYCSVVFVALIEWLVWSIAPDLLSIVGFILVSIAGIFIISASGSRAIEKE